MMRLMRHGWLVLAVLWFGVLASAAGAIYTRHRSRELFVERVATARLQMTTPDPARIRLVTP